MKPVAYVGADPGLSGAIALFLTYPQPYVEVFDMPARIVGEKRSINFWGLAAYLESWVHHYDVRHVVVERVHSMPKQGVASSFSFGFSAGALQQAIASAKLQFTLISPQTWKSYYGLEGGRENKSDSRAKATTLFPRFENLWARKKDDGRAEAVLLAHYASRLP
jgi:Holliday junction resolvasome RuvABC endonuclease subunit